VDLSAPLADGATPALVAQSPQQLRYALVMQWGTRLGLAVLVLSYLVYVTGWLPAHVPPQQLPQLWSQPLAGYLAATGSPTGWAWLPLLHHSDVLGLAGIAILAGCSMLALLALVPLYASQGDRTFVALCLLEALVVLTAASGVFG
jgi:hypothetical protein